MIRWKKERGGEKRAELWHSVGRCAVLLLEVRDTEQSCSFLLVVFPSPAGAQILVSVCYLHYYFFNYENLILLFYRVKNKSCSLCRFIKVVNQPGCISYPGLCTALTQSIFEFCRPVQ